MIDRAILAFGSRRRFFRRNLRKSAVPKGKAPTVTFILAWQAPKFPTRGQSCRLERID